MMKAMNSALANFTFPIYGSKSLKIGRKQIVATVKYDSKDREIFWVAYFDEDFDNSPVPMVCQSPTKAKTEASAMRMIRRFFNAK